MSASYLVYPGDLLAAPELAVLAVLDATLQQTLYSLFAAHPELVGSGTLETCWANGPDLWAADSVYDHITALQHALKVLIGKSSPARPTLVGCPSSVGG